MADLEFEDFEGDYGTPMAARSFDKATRLINLAGAVCSVALIAGLGIWGYQLAVRDVAGVPVMRAMAGPMRVAPADPGGDQASNQGLSVNAVAATGTSAPVAEQLTLAPRPVELLPDDMSGLGAAATDQPAQTDLVPVNLSISGQANPGSGPATEMAPLEEGASTLLDAETGAVVEVAAAEAADLVPTGAAVARSLRPQARPADMAPAAPSTPVNVETVSAPAAPAEISADTLEVGTRLAQLGAFDTPELARERFFELQGEFPDLMAGKAMVVQSAQSGGRTFYRLRAHGFPGDDEARRFCATLQAESTDCIPVAQR